MQLVTICFSHYNERARWALDYHGLEYRERPCMPLLHIAGVLFATRGKLGSTDRVSTRFSTPVLVRDDGSTLHDSGAILRWADERRATEDTTLYPAEHRDEIEAFEGRMHDRLGPHGRRLVYHHLLPQPALLNQLATDNVGAGQAALFKLARPIASGFIGDRLQLDPEGVARSMDVTRAELDAVDEMLLDGRPYLFGDRFTAADLTFASMATPLLLPTEFGAKLPGHDELPDEARAMLEEHRDRPSVRHARRMFAEHRRPCRPDWT